MPGTKIYQKEKKAEKIQRMPMWNVILLNDEEHSYGYVIHMLGVLFKINEIDAYKLACEIDSTGQAIVDTCPKERAELKQEQIHSFGADPHMRNSSGSMTALIEPCCDE